MTAYDECRASLDDLDAAIKKLPTKSYWALVAALALLVMTALPAGAFLIYRWLAY